MKKHLYLTQIRLRILFGLLALITTAILFSIFQPYFGKHRILLNDQKIFDQRIQDCIYYDFNHDGFSEHIIVKHDLSSHQDGIKFYTSSDGLVDQWTCGEPILKKAVYFADYDGDHHDEIYFFTKSAKDSLFLYALDPRQQNKFLIFRKLIVTAPKPNPNPRKIWDISTPSVVFFDSDHDGFKEMFIDFKSGFSLQPRGIFKFDIKSQKIVARSPYGVMVIGKPFLFDLDDDGIPEIITENSGAPANSHDNIPFSDQHPWLMVFDLNLNFFFKPIPFPYPFSDIATRVWVQNGHKYLSVLYDYHGTYAFPPTLYLYSNKGKLLHERKLSAKNRWKLYALPDNEFTHLYLINDSGKIYELDEQLRLILKGISSNPFFSHILSVDLDLDGQSELFGIGTKGYLIARSDFSDLTEFNKVKVDNRNIYSIKYKGKNRKPILVIQTPHNLNYLEYGLNPLHKLQYILALLSFLFFYLLFKFIFTLFQNRIYNREIKKELGQFFEKGLLVLSAKGRIRSVNGTFEQILKLNRHLQPGTHYALALEERRELVLLIDDMVNNLQLSEKEFTFNSDGQEIAIKFQGIILRGLFHIPVGFLILIEPDKDKITDEQLRIWIRTVQKMAHDIKAPLASIQLGLQTLQMKLDTFNPDGNLNTDFELLNSELQRVRELTKQFLRFTNLEKPNLVNVDLKALFQKALLKFRQFINEDLKIKIEIDPEIKIIPADPLLLEMVLQVVLENAIEALRGKGMILISANLIHNPEEGFKNLAEIEICDNGPGIGKDDMDKIFNPFYSTKSNGTGLGLAIAKNIIESHHGSISIDSREGFSTVVRILLPIQKTEEKDK